MLLKLREKFWKYLAKKSLANVLDLEDRNTNPEKYELGKLLGLMDKFHQKIEKKVLKGKPLTPQDKMRIFSMLGPTTMAVSIAEEKDIHSELRAQIAARMDKITEKLSGGEKQTPEALQQQLLDILESGEDSKKDTNDL